MLTQKVYKNGNSIAATLPKEYARELGIRDGSEIVVAKEKGRITIAPKNKKNASGVTPKFMEMVDNFAREHDDVLRGLAESERSDDVAEFNKWLDTVSRDEEKLIKILAKGYIASKKNSKE